MKTTDSILWMIAAVAALPAAVMAQLAGLADDLPATAAPIVADSPAEASVPATQRVLPAPTTEAPAASAANPAAPAGVANPTAGRPVAKPAPASVANPAVPSVSPLALTTPTYKTANRQAADDAEVAAALTADDEGRQHWRVSFGYEWRSPVKAKFQFVPSRYRAGKPQAFGSSYPTQGASMSAADKGDYENGYVHADSLTQIDGNTTAWSANDSSQYNSGNGTLTFSSTYSVGSTSIKQPTATAGEEEECFSGITFDISRDIWSSGSFSLRAAIGFSHDSRKDMIENTHAFSLGSSSLALYQRQDVYDVKYWGGVPPPSLQNQGAGETGAMIPATPASTHDVSLGGGGSAVYNGGASFAMDYRMTELRFALEPEYALASWLAVYGQAGVAVGKGKASWDVSSWFSTNGSKKTLSDSDEKEETFVDGFVGLGLRIMPIENLGVSVFGDYRFGTGEIEVDADPYTCKLETGKMRYGAALTLAF